MSKTNKKLCEYMKPASWVVFEYDNSLVSVRHFNGWSVVGSQHCIDKELGQQMGQY